MLSVYDKLVPKFCKVYSNVRFSSINALKEYNAEVKSSLFPQSGVHTYKMNEGEEAKFLNWAAKSHQDR